MLYQLVPTSQPTYESAPTAAFPPGGGPGEGEVIMGWELISTGVAFAMGKCQSVLAQPHNLLLTLQHPPAVLKVPYPIPEQLNTAVGSHFPPLPLDGETEEQVECDLWDLTRAKEWMDQSERVPVPTVMTSTRIPGLPVTYSMLTDDGRVYAIYAASQIELLRSDVSGGSGVEGADASLLVEGQYLARHRARCQRQRPSGSGRSSTRYHQLLAWKLSRTESSPWRWPRAAAKELLSTKPRTWRSTVASEWWRWEQKGEPQVC